MVEESVLDAITYAPFAGTCAMYDPKDAILQESTAGWRYGTNNKHQLLIERAGTGRTAFVLHDAGVVTYNARGGRVGPVWTCNPQKCPEAERFGEWFFGARDGGHFAINSAGAASPQLLIRADGALFAATPEQTEPDSTWTLQVGDANTKQVGRFLIGSRDSDRFVINTVGALVPLLVLTKAGKLYVTEEASPIASACGLRSSPQCAAGSSQTLWASASIGGWLVGDRDGVLSLQSLGAVQPAMSLDNAKKIASIASSDQTVISGFGHSAAGEAIKLFETGSWLFGATGQDRYAPRGSQRGRRPTPTSSSG